MRMSGGFSASPAALSGRCRRCAGRPRSRRRSPQRRPQVALDVVGERLQRRDVDEPDAGAELGARASLSIPQRKPARVLPEPVGAQISALAPPEIASQPPTWAGVGPSKEASNQRLTGALNGASGSDSGVGFGSVVNPPILLSRVASRNRVRRQSRALLLHLPPGDGGLPAALAWWGRNAGPRGSETLPRGAAPYFWRRATTPISTRWRSAWPQAAADRSAPWRKRRSGTSAAWGRSSTACARCRSSAPAATRAPWPARAVEARCAGRACIGIFVRRHDLGRSADAGKGRLGRLAVLRLPEARLVCAAVEGTPDFVRFPKRPRVKVRFLRARVRPDPARRERRRDLRPLAGRDQGSGATGGRRSRSGRDACQVGGKGRGPGGEAPRARLVPLGRQPVADESSEAG